MECAQVTEEQRLWTETQIQKAKHNAWPSSLASVYLTQTRVKPHTHDLRTQSERATLPALIMSAFIALLAALCSSARLPLDISEEGRALPNGPSGALSDAREEIWECVKPASGIALAARSVAQCGHCDKKRHLRADRPGEKYAALHGRQGLVGAA